MRVTMTRKMLPFFGIILGGLMAVLPASGVEAAEEDLCVTVQTDVELALDKSDPGAAVFSGEGDIYLTTENAYSHKFVAVALPEEFEMETPAGTKAAPEGTTVTFDGSMNARNGYENYKAKNGLDGKTADDIYMGKIRVSVPFSACFLEYGAGEYSLTIPVTFTAQTAYGSYSSYETGLAFTPWEELVSSGEITLSGTNLYRVSKRDMIMDIDPSITGISSLFDHSTYREVDIPSSVTSGYRVFQDSSVEKIVFGEGFTTIPNSLCYDATALTEVVMPDTVHTFKSDCFRNCVNLENITLPSEMSLESCCFANCKKITELHITDGVSVNVSLASYGPFVGSGLRKVIVEDGSTTVPKYICANCEEIDELYLPDTLTTMGYQCFTGMKDLKEVTIRSDVSQLNAYSVVPCFEDTGIETIIFTDGVTKVGRYLFAGGCADVTRINLPDSLTEIAMSAFEGCSSLTELEIPASVTTLGADCFEGAASLKELHIRADYALPRGTVISPFENSGIERLVIEEGVTSVASYMFGDGCEKMEELVLPTTLTTIGGDAFKNCRSLKTLTVRSNADVPRYSVVSPFEGGDLESITYVDGVTIVGAYLFNGACSSLTELNLPESIIEIKANAFAGCSSLSELELPSSVTTLGGDCFKGASSLKELHIRKDYTLSNGNVVSPFEDSGIERLVFEEGVSAIAAHLFDKGCSNVTELVLPATLETVGGWAFRNCTSLKSLVVRSNLRPPYSTVVSPFEGGNIEQIEFVSGVTSVGDYIFSGAVGGMTSLTLPEGMTAIGSHAFSGCTSLCDLYIPTTMQEISIEAFEDCVSLHTLNMNSSFRKPAGASYSPFENGGITLVNVADGLTEINANYLNNADGSQIRINIPGSVTRINSSVFQDGADYIVYYGGTQAQWEAVTKDDSFVPSQVICTDTVMPLMSAMRQVEIREEPEAAGQTNQEEQADQPEATDREEETDEAEQVEESEKTENGDRTDEIIGQENFKESEKSEESVESEKTEGADMEKMKEMESADVEEMKETEKVENADADEMKEIEEIKEIGGSDDADKPVGTDGIDEEFNVSDSVDVEDHASKTVENTEEVDDSEKHENSEKINDSETDDNIGETADSMVTENTLDETEQEDVPTEVQVSALPEMTAAEEETSDAISEVSGVVSDE